MSERLRARVSRWATASAFPSESSATWIAVVVLVAFTAVYWLVPLSSSFWMDETGTIWSIRGTLQESIARLPDAPAQQSVPFVVIMWLAAQLGGPLEVAVRLPSELAMVVAAVGVYLLARRFADRPAALAGTGVFITYNTVTFAAADARPYALAMAAVVWAVCLLIRWCETGKLAFGIGYAVLAALSIHLHYTCAVMLGVHLYQFARLPRASRPAPAQAGAVLTVLALLLVPLVAQVVTLWSARESHSFVTTPTTRDLVDAVINVRLVVTLLAGTYIARQVIKDFSWKPSLALSQSHRLAVAWFLLPVLAVYLMSWGTDAKLFVARYYIWSVPGLALVVTALLSSIDPPKARRLVALLLLIVCSVRPLPVGVAPHGGEDWRGATRRVQTEMDQRAPLLLQTGYTELRSGPSTEPSRHDDPMLSALSAYPAAGDVFLIPTSADDEVFRRLEALVASRLLQRNRIVLLTRASAPAVEDWLRGRLSAAGYTVESLGQFGAVGALVWHRPGS